MKIAYFSPRLCLIKLSLPMAAFALIAGCLLQSGSAAHSESERLPKLIGTLHLPMPVDSIAISPDGSLLAGGTNNSSPSGEGASIIVLNLKSHQVLSKADDYFGANDIVFSSDGKTLAVTSMADSQHPKAPLLQFFDAATGRPTSTPSIGRDIPEAIAFSTDGKHFAYGGSNCGVKVWSTKPLTLEHTFHEQPKGTDSSDNDGDGFDIYNLVFSPDGQTLTASYTYDVGEDSGRSEVAFWDLHTGKIRRRIIEPDHVITALAYSHNGRLLAVGLGQVEDAETVGSVRIFNGRNGLAIRTMNDHRGHNFDLCCLCFSGDDKLLFGGCSSDIYVDNTPKGYVREWSVADGRRLTTLSGAGGRVYALKVSRDGRFLSVASQYASIRFWRL